MRRRSCLLAAILVLSAARAADPPPLQEGLWEVHGRTIETPSGRSTSFSYRLCRNHAFDAAQDALVKNARECNTSFDDLGGGKFASSSSCTVAGRVIVSKGTYTYESATSTRSESHATYTPPFNGKNEETLVQDQRFLGACPTGMNPGDRIMADGSVQRYSP